MTEHKLLQGKRIIRFLAALGYAMGYVVKLEYPVAKGRKTGEVVDVAWLLDQDQEYPLFIFEVESRSSNAMSYNPMKVFSQPSSDLQKPVFLFQIILSGGADAGVVKSLREQYGKFNYEPFPVDSTGWESVIIRIFEQHRRLSLSFEYYKVMILLSCFEDADLDLQKIWEKVLDLRFHASILHQLPAIGVFALEKPESLPLYIRTLHSGINESKEQSIAKYSTYFGDQWSYPLHLGILAAASIEEQQANSLFENLRNWQDNDGHLTMIGPHFSLSYDYDQFLVWTAGSLVAILALLFRRVPRSAHYFSEVLTSVIEKTRPEWRVGNLIWLYHIISPIDRNCGQYHYAVRELEAIGGFNLDTLLNPSSGYFNDDMWVGLIQGSQDFSGGHEPNAIFTSIRTHVCSWKTEKPENIALKFLLADLYGSLPINQLLKGLQFGENNDCT